ncbi:MAG: 3-dehydroquinate dehydratase, partial [Clostridia bacterium]|nr:3-dehydroquinate dehydratase [Clostridia bacterium]
PNLNLLGTRQPEIYGSETLQNIEDRLKKTAEVNSIILETFQSNSEGEIVDKIQQSRDYDGLIINAGAYTHTSVAIADAISGVGITAIEVHISNIYKREEFRHHSFLSMVCKGGIFGLGSKGYDLALSYFINGVI